MAEKDSTMHWYVARTRYFRQEIKIRDWFDAHQVESFVPTTRIRTVRKSHRKSTVIEKPLAPNLVFVRTTKDSACAFITDNRLPMQYYIDCATHRMMIVPDKDMDDFRRVFDVSIEEGGLIDQPLEVGERVRVIEGPLQGVEGFVFELLGKYYVVVSLLNFLWAKAQVPRAWLQKI